MISFTIGDKKYTIDKVMGRAMREIGDMDELYKRAIEGEAIPSEEMDTAANWMRVVFNNQFTVDDFIDNVPNDKWWQDVFTFYLAVKNGVTNKLADFPTHPEATEA